MTLIPPRLANALWRNLPAPLQRKLSTSVGKRFSRFVLVAVASLVASEIALVIFLDGVHLTSGVSGVAAAIVGAAVSYVLSRWAWERKGRPQLLRETLPFWLVSVGAWIVLGLATHLGVSLAKTMQVHGIKKTIVVGGVYFLANCLTFAARFLIFHFLLFADRRVNVVDELAVVEGGEPPLAAGTVAAQPATADPAGPAAAGPSEAGSTARPSQVNGGTPGLNGGTPGLNGGTAGLNGGTAGLNGGTAGLNGGTGQAGMNGGQSGRRRQADRPALPVPGTRH
jgi:putative flippase GtrA